MNNLHRELAPVSAAAWAGIEEEAKRTFARHAAARKSVDVTGPDLDVALNQKLLEIATEINNAYTNQINSSPTQLLYDDITDHSRNGTVAKDAVDHAIKNAAIEAAPAAN